MSLITFNIELRKRTFYDQENSEITFLSIFFSNEGSVDISRNQTS